MIRRISYLMVLPLLLGQAYARAQNPAYIDVQLLYSVIDYKLTDLAPTVSARDVRTRGFNFKVALGYWLTSRWAVELGALWSYRPTYEQVTAPIPASGFSDLIENKNVKNNVVYLVAQYGLPLGSRWQVYGKGGIGYVARRGFAINGIQNFSSRLIVTPVAGLGVLFHIAHHWDADMSWTQAFRRSHYQLPALNFFGLGVIYRFRIV